MFNHCWKRRFHRQLLIRKIYSFQAPQIELRVHSPHPALDTRTPHQTPAPHTLPSPVDTCSTRHACGHLLSSPDTLHLLSSASPPAEQNSLDGRASHTCSPDGLWEGPLPRRSPCPSGHGCPLLPASPCPLPPARFPLLMFRARAGRPATTNNITRFFPAKRQNFPRNSTTRFRRSTIVYNAIVTEA